MAFYTIRINLGASSFPLLTDLAGRTIIVPGQDEHYDRQVISTTADSDKDKGNPQAFYMENVVPTVQGLQSIGYTSLLASDFPNVTDFSPSFAMQTSEFGRIILSPSGGKNYILDKTVGDGRWNLDSAFPPGTVPEGVQVTEAFLKGETYVFYKKYGCFKYDTTAKQLVVVAFTGITATDIVAICAASGYMIAFTETAVAWSSLLDPTDFTPDITTGAGGGQLNEAVGKIIAGFSMAGGFMVYCEGNIVSARVSGNTNFPFIFNQVPGSGGITSVDQVSWESSIADQFAWTTVGIQQVSSSAVKNLLPEVTDYIAGKQLETFDSSISVFTQTYLTEAMRVSLHVIGLRYLIISYGPNYPDYDYCLLYDLTLKRYGKLKITHRDVIEWNYPNTYGDLTYDMLGTLTYDEYGFNTTYDELTLGTKQEPIVKETIAFIKANGDIVRINFTFGNDTADGVLLLGKYQFVRNLFITWLRSEFEVVDGGANNFTQKLLLTLDGKTFLPAKSVYQFPPSSKLRIFQGKKTGANFSLLLGGAFNLVSAEIKFNLGGTR